MKWVTRERPKIDRVACPWLIARFIDTDPEFLYVPAGQVFEVARERAAIPYDIPGAELSHVGDLCSFDAFLKRYALDEPALHTLATIVRGADTSRLELTPQSAGLYAISLGLSSWRSILSHSPTGLSIRTIAPTVSTASWYCSIPSSDSQSKRPAAVPTTIRPLSTMSTDVTANVVTVAGSKSVAPWSRGNWFVVIVSPTLGTPSPLVSTSLAMRLSVEASYT